MDGQVCYSKVMKINREMVTRAGLKLLNEDGLEQLTLRRLGVELNVQAATIYWHFKSKEELLDEMATMVLAEGAANLIPVRKTSDWRVWALTFGEGLRKTLLAYRDGARMVAGTRLTNSEYLKTTERIGSQMLAAGFQSVLQLFCSALSSTTRRVSSWKNKQCFRFLASGRLVTLSKSEMRGLILQCFRSSGRRRRSCSIDMIDAFVRGWS